MGPKPPVSPGSPPATPLRADARRNRARVLQAAEEAFATEGLTVPLDEIARRAGVGAGTVYRQFPTKEALFAAVMHNRAQQYVVMARELGTAEDPGQALVDFLSLMFDEGGMKRDLFDALSEAGVDVSSSVDESSRELRDAIAELLMRAQRAGAVRDDIDVAEIMVIVAAVAVAGRRAEGTALRRRVLGVIVDGLTAGSPAPAISPSRRGTARSTR